MSAYIPYITHIFMIVGINIIAVTGLSIFTGFTGLFSLGHAAFVGIGAYISGILTYYEYTNYYVALLAGMAGATVASLIIGIPTLRAKLRSDYFAIATLGFGEALRVTLDNLDITNGARGLGLEVHTTPIVLLFSLVAVLFTASNFLKSRYGAACIAIREDSIAAEMSGVNLFRTRLLSLVLSAAFCGLSGGLLAHYFSFIKPDMFMLVQSTQLLATVIAGGMGSLSGPAIVSLVFMSLPEILRWLEMWRLPAYGLLLVLIMIHRPQGLMGYRELTDFFVIFKRREKGGKN
ncbi:MAG: branched-chain amino acid ABC transporter permease [Synergistaceae bacterium]|nr:branched-chain amino acid ABC transporter permease [Synergistaceae bacterium]